MKGFARVTKLTNIGGRADYISNPARQEEIVAKSEAVDWKPYQDFERANQRTAKRNNEGREVIIAIPNEWASLPPAELESRCHVLSNIAAGKSTDMQWAVHWNKAHSDLHIHVIFSERQKNPNAGRWDRDIYLTADGKVARKKADRAKNPDGSDKPPVHRKGEEKGGFTSKDKTYTMRSWVSDTKSRLYSALSERWGVEMEKPDFLHQYHEGKGEESSVIRTKNEVIRANNQRLKDLVAHDIDIEKMLPTFKAHLKDHYTTVLHLDGQSRQPVLTQHVSPAQALEHIKVTEQNWQRHILSIDFIFYFYPLLVAQKDYYQECFALADDRKPLDPITQKAPVELSKALSSLEAAQDGLSAASREKAKFEGFKGIFRGTEKKAAAAAYSEQVRIVQNRIDRIGTMGVDIYFDDEKLTPDKIVLENVKNTFVARVEARISELNRVAAAEKQRSRPTYALDGSQRRQNAARDAFIVEMGRIPPERQKAAREALRASESDLAQGYDFADEIALSAVKAEADYFLSAQTDFSANYADYATDSSLEQDDLENFVFENFSSSYQKNEVESAFSDDYEMENEDDYEMEL